MNDIKRPFDMINRLVGKKIEVAIKSGKIAIGVMNSFDVHMNIVLENAKWKGEDITYERIFIRGDSVVYLAPASEQ